MSGKNLVETLMGALVIFVAIGFIIIAYRSGNVATKAGSYPISARFKEVGSLSIGSDIRVSGIKIGSVTDQRLDPDSYMAVVTLNIEEQVKIPKDSTAAIVSDGLLGGKYIAIEPGGDNTMLKEDDVLKYTQDAINIESLIGKFAFGGVGDKAEEPAEETETEENNAVPTL